MLRNYWIPWLTACLLTAAPIACNEDDDNGDDSNDDGNDSNDDGNDSNDEGNDSNDEGGDSSDDGNDSGDQCVEAGDDCDINGDCCGFDDGDTVCTNFDGPKVCADYCNSGAECLSGCCVALEEGGGVCAPADLCG